MVINTEWACGYCGEMSEASVDLMGGEHQSYVEDCTVCCRPNMLYISIDADSGEAVITAEFEG